ncbi:MAG: hypothetical protein JW820_12385 [Spirochaetales bacterium]|nr:hypothetical protein [Spirochaetales bacterium]
MKPEDRSKLQSYLSELSGLKSRTPEEKKFKDWKENVEKKLDEIFGKGSAETGGFRRIRFFDFGRQGKSKDVPLTESERREYLDRLEEARRFLQHLV